MDIQPLIDAKQLLEKYSHADVYYYSDTLTLRWKEGNLKGQLNWKCPQCCQFLRDLHSRNPDALTTTILKSSVDEANGLIEKESIC